MPAVTRQSDGSFLANGRASLDDVRAVIGDEFDVGDAAQKVDTLGGYLVIRAVMFRSRRIGADRRRSRPNARCRSAPGQARQDLPPQGPPAGAGCGARTGPQAVKTPPTPAARPTPSPRDEANRPSTNTQPTP